MTAEQEKALIEKFDKLTAEEKDKWQREIKLLEQRTEEQTDLDIGGGTKITIFAHLNEKRKKVYANLIKELQSLGTKKKVGTGLFNEDGVEIEEWKTVLSKDNEKRAEEIAYEMMAFATVNPLFTVDWFKENQDKFAMEDILNNILLYYNLQAVQWIDRVKNIKSFRTEPGGTKLR